MSGPRLIRVMAYASPVLLVAAFVLSAMDHDRIATSILSLLAGAAVGSLMALARMVNA